MHSFLFPAAELHCPVSAYAEIGNYAVLNCSLEAFHNLYWYKDTSTGTSPIVKIENNKKYILERTGHFNISDDGSLLIRDIKGEHLGRYEIIHFRRDNEIEKSNVELKIAKKPSKRCPQIADCAKCDECTLVMKVGNDVSCTSLESRPLINVTFDVLGDNGSTFTDPIGTVYYNNVSDTWNTSSTIHLKSPNCSRFFNLTCSVEGNNLFDLSYSFAVIRVDNTNRRHNDNVEVELTTKPLLNVEGENTENTTISKDLEKMTDHLIQCLKDEYNTLSFIKPLPWGREIHIKHVYTASSFDVITPKESCSVSSTEFLESSDQDTMKRVIFIAALGHGKSTLQQYLAWKWSEKSKESKNERLLFFLHAKGIDINKGIAEALYSKLPADLQQILRVEDLAYILTNRKCRIVIDGLDEIAPNTEEKEKYNVLTPGDIQIRGLLQNSNLDDYRDMQLWVTSRELDNDNAHFFPPFTEIHMRALTTQQLENYVEKVSVECMSFRYSDGHLKMVPDEFTKQITLPKMKQVLFVEMSIGSDDTLIALIRMANDHAIENLGYGV
ncbi:hypothetical protein BSL78_28383 [Apostichopus japonicus]|uniref:NACHT domain-containing protein n=1 Tax=Stichopus japonicus TaxID=307972 RepID=A0A2G8JGB2_STIJA|nr:hypothetical protein BSL78_28383 [Apostichopus japonicus]